MEDFGLMKGTKFDFAKEWSEREGGKRFEDVLSEAHANQAYGQLAMRNNSYREADTFFELALRAYNSEEDRTGACSTLQVCTVCPQLPQLFAL